MSSLKKGKQKSHLKDHSILQHL